MPSYEATPEELDRYGAGLNIWQQLMLLQAWSPLIGYAQRFVQTIDPYAKAVVVGEAAEWVASKTDAKLDDQVVKLVSNILKTKEGEALVRFLLLQVEAAK